MDSAGAPSPHATASTDPASTPAKKKPASHKPRGRVPKDHVWDDARGAYVHSVTGEKWDQPARRRNTCKVIRVGSNVGGPGISVLIYAQNARDEATLRATVKAGSGVVHKLEQCVAAGSSSSSWMELIPEESRAPEADATEDAASLIGSALEVLQFKHDRMRLAKEIGKKRGRQDAKDGAAKRPSVRVKTVQAVPVEAVRAESV